MYSIIIPTMWRSKNLITFVHDLASHQLVSEIIIIDNNPLCRPDDMILSCHYKLRVITSGENMYVNPAWNLGVDLAVNDKVCILTDSTIFDLKLLRRVFSFITHDIGVVGINWNYEIFNDGMIRIRSYTDGFSANNFFRCFFVNKHTWKPIPSGLNLYFGDNYIWDNCLWDNKRIYVANDVFLYTEFGSTTGSMNESSEMFDNEKIIYRDIILSKGLDPKKWCPTHFKD
jgi:hypothetical protein